MQEQQLDVGGILCSTASLGCVTLGLQTTVRTVRPIPVSIDSTFHFSFCFTNPAACAQFEGDTEGLTGGSESTDEGFPRERPQPEGEALVTKAEDCGPLSFAPETRVTTDHGQQTIGTLQVGERVLAYNPKTGKMEQEPILHVWINHDHDLVDLTITTTIKGEHGKPATKTSEVVHTNQKHPFFTMEHGFSPVGQIKLGMHILRADGRVGVVTGWKVVPGVKTMYNLEVAQDHTFTVGTGQWVVHNSGGLCDDGALRPVNSQGNPYPHITDLRTEEDVPFPSGTLQEVDRADRVEWDSRYDRAAFIREWYDRGFSEPPGGWDPYDIHHILPREYGGTNDFWNLTPVDRDFHNQVITPWWNAYVP